MGIDFDELGSSYAASSMKKYDNYRVVEWEFGKMEGDNVRNGMSSPGDKMLYNNSNWVDNGGVMGSSMINDFVGSGDVNVGDLLSSLPEDPFCRNIRSALNKMTDWIRENQVEFGSKLDEPIDVDQVIFGNLDCFSNDTTISDLGGLGEVTADNALSSLSEDPFCMKIRSTFNRISSWLDENQMDSGGFGSGSYEPIGTGQRLFGSLDCVSNGTTMLNGEINDFWGLDRVTVDSRISSLPDDLFSLEIRSTLNTESGCFDENQMDLDSEILNCVDQLLGSLDFISDDTTTLLTEQIGSLKINDFGGFGGVTIYNGPMKLPDDPFCMSYLPTWTPITWLYENQREIGSKFHNPIAVNQMGSLGWFWNPTTVFQHKISSSSAFLRQPGEPHDAFELVLPYLELKGLLAVEGVCKSLRDSVRKDDFLWRTIDLDMSLTYKVTDDSLLKLTRRAQGNLQCLDLDGCVGITDDGLMQVLASNPRLTKLSISGCLKLSTAGLLSNLRDLKSSNRLALKSIITGGVLYFTKKQFKELYSLLGADAKAIPRSKKKRFYKSSRSDFMLEENRVSDLEICPWCNNPSLVFDCPAEFCPFKNENFPKLECRACIICITRCHDCGSCLNDCECKLFCFAFNCGVCYKKRLTQLEAIRLQHADS